MPAPRRAYYRQVFGWFAVADRLVLDNLDSNVLGLVRAREAHYLFQAQAVQEQSHDEAYSRQIEELFDGPEREALFRAMETLPAVAR